MVASLRSKFFKSAAFVTPDLSRDDDNRLFANYLTKRVFPQRGGDEMFDIVDGEFTVFVALRIFHHTGRNFNVVRSVRIPLLGTAEYSVLCSRALRRMALRHTPIDIDACFKRAESIAIANNTQGVRKALHFETEKAFLTAIASQAQRYRDITHGEAGLIRLVSYEVTYTPTTRVCPGELQCFTETDLMQLVCPEFSPEELISERSVNPVPEEESLATLGRIMKQANGDPEMFCTLLSARPHLKMYLSDKVNIL